MAEPDDTTVTSRRKKLDTDDTVVSRGAIPDDVTLSDTVASLRERRDRTRKIDRDGARSTAMPQPGAPGVLADGRVASQPGRHVERYPVRVVEAPPLDVVRKNVLPPLVEARRNLDAAAIAGSAIQKRRAQAAGVVGAAVGATVVGVGVVVFAIVLLSQR